jgi:hypothetical protein
MELYERMSRSCEFERKLLLQYMVGIEAEGHRDRESWPKNRGN